MASPTQKDKYRVTRPAKSPIQPNEIRVSTENTVLNYTAYAAKLLSEQKLDVITFRATGFAIHRAISSAEITRRKFAGLHQVTHISMVTVCDTYEPLEEGLEEIRKERDVPAIEITLSTNDQLLDTKAPGYQPPLPQSELDAFDAAKEERLTGGGRGRGGGRGGGGGRGRGMRGGRGRGRGGSGGGGALTAVQQQDGSSPAAASPQNP